MDLLDVVELLEDLPVDGLKRGMRGAIVHLFDKPIQAYEVEFCDEFGRTIAQVALLPSQIRLVWRSATHKPSRP